MAGRKRNVEWDDPFVFLQHLAREGVPFVIVGGAALALHGIPRATLDVDLVVPASDSILARLFSAAARAGMRSKQADLPKIPDPTAWAGQWVTFQDAGGREWIDVFLEEPRRFGRLMRSSVKERSGQLRLCVAGLRDIERMKRESGRPIDLADIALIHERRRAGKRRR